MHSVLGFQPCRIGIEQALTITPFLHPTLLKTMKIHNSRPFIKRDTIIIALQSIVITTLYFPSLLVANHVAEEELTIWYCQFGARRQPGLELSQNTHHLLYSIRQLSLAFSGAYSASYFSPLDSA